MSKTECLSCKSLSGEKRISPGDIIYENASWQVEHAYPTGLACWLVIVLKEHKEAMHELSSCQSYDLISIIRRVTPILKKLTGCQKEYVLILGEAPGHQHLHVHIIPRAEDIPDEFKGVNIFQYLKVPQSQTIPGTEIQKLCLSLKNEFKLAFQNQ